jgi:hypothetical protein
MVFTEKSRVQSLGETEALPFTGLAPDTRPTFPPGDIPDVNGSVAS